MTDITRGREVHKVVYMYRDAGNYKFWGEFHVAGELTLNDLQPYLLRSEYFVPERVGIASLIPEQRNDDDHSLHEIDSITPSRPAPCVATASEMVERFRAARGSWFRTANELWF